MPAPQFGFPSTNWLLNPLYRLSMSQTFRGLLKEVLYFAVHASSHICDLIFHVLVNTFLSPPFFLSNILMKCYFSNRNCPVSSLCDNSEWTGNIYFQPQNYQGPCLHILHGNCDLLYWGDMIQVVMLNTDNNFCCYLCWPKQHSLWVFLQVSCPSILMNCLLHKTVLVTENDVIN